MREPQEHVPGWTEPRKPVDLKLCRDGRNPALNVLFADMVRRGTILDATLWAYSSEMTGSNTLPPLPSGSCDESVGGAITGQAYRAGVLIDAGTDNVADSSDLWPDLFHELAMLKSKAGMPNAAVLQSATLIAARAAGQQQQMGSIEPGKLANMVVLARDPLINLNNLRSVTMTIKRGRVFDRSTFVPLRQGDITDR